jgi:hypothetical protein
LLSGHCLADLGRRPVVVFDPAFQAARKVTCGSLRKEPRERQHDFDPVGRSPDAHLHVRAVPEDFIRPAQSRFLLGGNSMSKEQSLILADRLDRDLYTDSQTRERALNAAIVQADISESFEEFLEIFDAFYADDLEVSSETGEQSIRGKASVRALLANFLIPLHLMAEVAGLLISIRQTPTPGDTADETHSAWTLELVGVSGRTCILSWRTLRKWNGLQVKYEYHYDEQQSGGPLTSADLSFYGAMPATGFRGRSGGQS